MSIELSSLAPDQRETLIDLCPKDVLFSLDKLTTDGVYIYIKDGDREPIRIVDVVTLMETRESQKEWH